MAFSDLMGNTETVVAFEQCLEVRQGCWHLLPTLITRCSLRWRQTSLWGSSLRCWRAVLRVGLSCELSVANTPANWDNECPNSEGGPEQCNVPPTVVFLQLFDLDSSLKLQCTYTHFRTYFMVVRLVSSTESQTVKKTSSLTSSAILNPEEHSK